MWVKWFPIAFAILIIGALVAIVWRFLSKAPGASRTPSAPPPAVKNPRPVAAPATPAAGSAGVDTALQMEAIRAVHALALGISTPSAAIGPLHQEITTAAVETLRGVADKPNYAPRRPMLLPKLVQAMNDDDVSRRELSGIISGDPALAGSLLRLANSPFYRLNPEPIESLDRAVAVLGIEGMRSLISAALLQPVFRTSSGSFAKFGDISWRHTLCAAKAAEAHAAVVEDSDPFAAQLLALMMGLATVVVFKVGSDEYLARRVPADAGVLARLIETQTASVASSIAASWELSERMSAALIDQRGTPASSLGRSLQFGEYLGALAVLREYKLTDDDAVAAQLKSAGTLEAAYARIWARLVANTAEQPA